MLHPSIAFLVTSALLFSFPSLKPPSSSFKKPHSHKHSNSSKEAKKEEEEDTEEAPPTPPEDLVATYTTEEGDRITEIRKNEGRTTYSVIESQDGTIVRSHSASSRHPLPPAPQITRNSNWYAPPFPAKPDPTKPIDLPHPTNLPPIEPEP